MIDKIPSCRLRPADRPMSPPLRALSPTPTSPTEDYDDTAIQRSPLKSPLYNGEIKTRPTIDYGHNTCVLTLSFHPNCLLRATFCYYLLGLSTSCWNLVWSQGILRLT